MKKLLQLLQKTHNLLLLPCDRRVPGGDGYVYVHPDHLPDRPCVPLVCQFRSKCTFALQIKYHSMYSPFFFYKNGDLVLSLINWHMF